MKLCQVAGLTVLVMAVLSACMFHSEPEPASVEKEVWMPPIRRLEPRAPQPPLPEMSRMTAAIAAELKRNHYAPPEIDDQLSEKIYSSVMTAADPWKLFLTQDDVDRLAVYKDTLDDEILQNRLSFPWLVSEVVSRRAEEFLIFARELLATSPDCNTGERFEMNRDRAMPPLNADSQRKLWSGFVKNELIRVRQLRRITADTSLHFDGLKKESPYLARFSEEERVMLRLRQLTYSFRHPPQRTPAEQFLAGLTANCDPHCAFNSPKDFARRMAGLNLTFAGIGVMYNNDDGVSRVLGIVPDGPAEKQGGLREGDILLSASEEGAPPVSLHGLPANTVSDLIRGPKGSKVIFKVVNADTPDSPVSEVTLIRDEITHQPASASAVRRQVRLNDGSVKQIAVVRLPIFYSKPPAKDGKKRGASDEIRDLISEFTEQGNLDGVILDLRSNPGGYLPEAIRVANLFVDAGPVVQIRSRSRVDILTSVDTKAFYDGPLAVLINRHSASASEIVSGAIKDYNRGLILGDEATFGKGTVQQVIDMTQHSQRLGLPIPAGGLSLTTAKFYRVNGETTQIKGVPSDIIIPSPTNIAAIGEKNIPNAIPFDTISPVTFNPVKNSVTPFIESLTARSEKRTRSNPVFKSWIPKVDTAKVVCDTAIVPPPVEPPMVVIDEEQRYQSFLDEVKRIKAQRQQPPPPPMPVTDSALPPPTQDVILEESLAVMADYISALRESGENPKIL